MSDLTDRRRAPRISCNLSVEYVVRGGDPLAGRITNIGTLGMLLLTQEGDLPVGAELLLRLILPLSNRPIQAEGTVRWATFGRAGVEVGHLTLQAQDDIWRAYARDCAEQDSWRRLIRE